MSCFPEPSASATGLISIARLYSGSVVLRAPVAVTARATALDRNGAALRQADNFPEAGANWTPKPGLCSCQVGSCAAGAPEVCRRPIGTLALAKAIVLINRSEEHT